jgi:hypothetical protein
LASAGKYRIVSVGKGIAAEDDEEESSLSIIYPISTTDGAYIMISKMGVYL